ncbi:DUF6612 family protein [Salipaludibacillus daqingensis]|uniref:DUF6612 family protein n=1 Tax=Salipaludibacillus daqingensis TaxID=3041001 RepID=UPI002472FEC7|nr:DUF6612 family protein [Salipaludibacillus daqingensis]
MMKRKGITIVSGLALLTLTACGEVTSEDGMSVEDILNQSISAMEDLDSYSITMDMAQVMNIGEEEGVDLDSSGEISVTMDPMAMIQKSTVNMGELGMGDEEELEYISYFTEEDGFYVEDPMMGNWLKLPDSLMEDMVAMSDAQMSPEKQLEPFKDYISDLSMETTDDTYVITLAGDGIDMNELMDQMGGMGLEGMDPMVSEMMGELDIESLNYEFVIDRETFYQLESTIDMKMSVDFMGESMTTEQTVHMVMTDFNSIEAIEIPQEVLENAEEMSEEDMMGGGF